jgi:YVTN family beta-propeller protein
VARDSGSHTTARRHLPRLEIVVVIAAGLVFLPGTIVAPAAPTSGLLQPAIAPGAIHGAPSALLIHAAKFGGDGDQAPHVRTSSERPWFGKNTVVATVPVGANPATPAFDVTNGNLYVPNFASANLSIVSGAKNTVIGNVYVGSYPESPTYDPANGDIYVPTANNVSVVSGATGRVVQWIGTGGRPGTPAYDSATGNLYVSNEASGNVSVIDGANNSLNASVVVGKDPLAALYDPANGEIYVPNANGGNGRNISVISDNNNTVVATIPVSSSPLPGTLDPATGDLFFPLQANFTVVSGASNTVITTLMLRYGPHTPAFDPANGEMYFPQYGSSQTTAIFGSNYTGAATIQTGGTPVPPTYDPQNGEIYVASEYNSEVSVISDLNNSVVTNVSVGSWPDTPTLDSVNGDLYVANTQSNDVSVIAGRVPVYPVFFNETGLPANSNWSLTLNSSTNRSTNASIGFSVSEGTYNFSVADVPGFHQTTLPYRGQVTVLNGPVAEPTLVFSRITYFVNFSESALPQGQPWSVSLNGISEAGSTQAISFIVPNGSYPFQIGSESGYRALPSSGNVTVNGAALNRTITFSSTLETFSVVFNESGLLSGSNWSVTLNGSTVSGIGPLTFQGLLNGTYRFKVPPTDGANPNPSNGSVNVAGATVDRSIAFQHVQVCPGTQAIGVLGPAIVCPPIPTGGPPPTTFLGLPPLEGYALVGGLIAVIVAGIFVFARRRPGNMSP